MYKLIQKFNYAEIGKKLMDIAKKIEMAFSLLSSKRVMINYDYYMYKPLLFRNNEILFANDRYLKKTIAKKDSF